VYGGEPPDALHENVAVWLTVAGFGLTETLTERLPPPPPPPPSLTRTEVEPKPTPPAVSVAVHVAL
jgi:hypothetical protein